MGEEGTRRRCESRCERRMLAMRVAHDALLVYGPFLVFLCGALVVVLLTLGQGYLHFDQMPLPIHLGGDTGVALLLNGGD